METDIYTEVRRKICCYAYRRFKVVLKNKKQNKLANAPLKLYKSVK